MVEMKHSTGQVHCLTETGQHGAGFRTPMQPQAYSPFEVLDSCQAPGGGAVVFQKKEGHTDRHSTTAQMLQK